MHISTVCACAVLLVMLSTVRSYADKRVALVIGNGAYLNTAALPNPGNDADDMAAALRDVGFDVIIEKDVNKRSLELAMARFARVAQDADAALFYYAGHGMQYRGVNYLMPVDARLDDEFSVNYELIRIDDVLFAVSGARGVKILILDSCRDNPLADRLRSRTATREIVLTRGLARIEATRGMIVAFATQPNQVAIDGAGRNSPFTGALLQEIQQPGLEIVTLLRRVTTDVNRATGGQQLPELSISMSGEFYLNTHDTDAQAWTKMRSSSNITELQQFIRQYPQSFLVIDARARIAVLEREQAARELAERRRQQAERERLEAERAARQQAERERLEAEQAARQQAERERLEAERAAREQAERNRLEAERSAREQAERERLEAERAARQQAERERLEAERIAREQGEAALERSTTAEEHSRREGIGRESVEGERRAGEVAERETASRDRPTAGSVGNEAVATLTPPAEMRMPTSPAVSEGVLILEIKRELKRVGCYVGRIDEKWRTPEIRESIRNFVREARLSPVPVEPTSDFLDVLRSHSERVCLPGCGARELDVKGRCVVKTCAGGQRPGKDGTCVAAAVPPPKPVPHSSQSQPSQSRSTGRRCFAFGSRSFCE